MKCYVTSSVTDMMASLEVANEMNLTRECLCWLHQSITPKADLRIRNFRVLIDLVPEHNESAGWYLINLNSLAAHICVNYLKKCPTG